MNAASPWPFANAVRTARILRHALVTPRRKATCAATLALYLASIVLAYGLSVRALGLCALVLVLLAAALTDLAERIIPNELIAAGIAAWAATLPFLSANPRAFGMETLVQTSTGSPALAALASGLAGGLGTAGLLLLLALLLDALTGRRNLGGGDVKLLFLTGLYLGFAGNLLAVFAACLLSATFTTARSLRREPGTPASRSFPFGPFIAAGAWFALVFGQGILAAC